jgi:hypothetical protein
LARRAYLAGFVMVHFHTRIDVTYLSDTDEFEFVVQTNGVGEPITFRLHRGSPAELMATAAAAAANCSCGTSEWTMSLREREAFSD